MPYDIKNLSKEALQKLFIVLKDIDLYSELRNRVRFLFISTNRKSKFITKTDHIAIIEELIFNKTIKESLGSFIFFPNVFLIHIGNPFFDFYNKVKLELAKREKTDIQLTFKSSLAPELTENQTKQYPPEDKLRFDEEKSILYIQGHKVLIAKQKKETHAHKILKYIFVTNKDNLNDVFYYSEMVEDFTDAEGYHEYLESKNGWRRYFDACGKIQEKVKKETKDLVKDFLIFNSGKSAWVKINPKYL